MFFVQKSILIVRVWLQCFDLHVSTFFNTNESHVIEYDRSMKLDSVQECLGPVLDGLEIVQRRQMI